MSPVSLQQEETGAGTRRQAAKLNPFVLFVAAVPSVCASLLRNRPLRSARQKPLLRAPRPAYARARPHTLTALREEEVIHAMTSAVVEGGGGIKEMCARKDCVIYI